MPSANRFTFSCAVFVACLGAAAVSAQLPTSPAKAAATVPSPPQPPAITASTGPGTVSPTITAADLDKFAWRWIGPMTFSGRMTAFAVPRGQSQTYYVLTASSGIWKTEDGGIHFAPIFDKGDTLSMGWLAIAPSNPNVLYLGTGEPMHARSSTHGTGMWKSTDAGKTWTKIGLEKSYFIPKVEVDARNPDIVYAAAEGKLYDNEMDCERGLFKSTDGGQTWVNVLTPVTDRGVADFVIDPTNSDVIIAAAYKTFRRAWTYIDRHVGNDLYKSVDGGKTWKKLTHGFVADAARGRTGLAIFEKNPRIVYARVDEAVVLGFPEREGVANFRTLPTGPGGGFSLAAAGTTLFRPDASLVSLKAYGVPKEMSKVAPKFVPLTVGTEADTVKALNDLIADQAFFSKHGIDLPKLQAVAKRIHAKDEDVIESITNIETLMKKEPAKADSPEAKARQQILNRHALELLYAGQLAVLKPQTRSGVVYRSDDQGETWTRRTVYRLGGAGGSSTHEDEREMGEERPSEDDNMRGGAYPDGQAGTTPSGSAPAAQAPSSAQINQTEAGYYGRITIDPNNDQILYCGDTNTTVSRDGGQTFQVTGWDGTGKTHVDHRAVWVDPLNSNHILSANDGAASETWDGGKHWSQKSGIRAQQFYDVAVDNERPYQVMGGTQDNGSWIGPSQNRNSYGMFGADWRYLPTGDGFYVVRDWWNPDFIYYESQFGSSSRQNLRTGETQPLAVRLTPEQILAGDPALRYQWNAPIVLSPHNPGIVFTASQYVWRSLSRGETGSFYKISPDLTKADKDKIRLARKTNLQWATVYTFAESPRKPGVYWAGTDDGNVQLSTDGGVNWTNITNQFYDAAGKTKPGLKGDLIPYDRWVKRVVPSMHDTNTCYVAFNGYRTHNEDKTWLFMTTDLGKTWTDISGGMPHAVFDVEEDPDNANVLYLGTEHGVYVTIDRGRSWTAFSTSQPTMVIRDLAIQKRDRELAIGTYARGIWIADIGPFREFQPEVFQSAAHLFEPTAAIKWNRFERRGDTYGEFPKAENPPVGASVYYYLGADAKSVTVTIKDLEGTVVQDVTASARKGLQKIFWNLAKQAPANAEPVPAANVRVGRVNLAEPGTYHVTLTVDGKAIATKKLKVLADEL